VFSNDDSLKTLKEYMQTKRTHGGCKYATREEAIEANRQKARERYQMMKEDIKKQYKEDPAFKEKRKSYYLQRKQKEEEIKLDYVKMQEQLLLYQQLL
jgi:hypothetical protein